MDDKKKNPGKGEANPERRLAPTRGQTISRDEWIARALAAASSRKPGPPKPSKPGSGED